MEPELKESEYLDPPKIELDVELDNGSNLPKLPSASQTSETSEQWRQIGEKIYAFLSGLPDYLGDFFGEYKRPIITVGLIFGSVVSVKLTLALLDAINDIPLLSPTFELVGLGYSAWFIYRYLLRASSRQELAQEVSNLKDQIIGNKSFPGSGN